MRPRRAVAAALALLALGATAVALPRAADATRSLPLWRLSTVLVTGCREIPVERIVAASGLTTGTNLFLIDLPAVAARIARDPWVSTCRLARALPDRIVIEVTERTPAAVLQRADGFWLADAAGHLIEPVASPLGRPSLPLVTAGDDAVTAAESVAAACGIARAMAAWKGTLPPVSEIVVFSGGAAEVYALDRPLRVVLPAGDAAEAIRRWASLGPVLASAGDRAHSLDLRHRDRAYLRQEETGGSQG